MTKRLDGRGRQGPSAFYVDDINYDVDSTHGDEFFVAAHSYLPILTREDIAADMAREYGRKFSHPRIRSKIS